MTFLRLLLILSFLHCYLAQSRTKKVVTIIGRDAVLSCPWMWSYKADLVVTLKMKGERFGFWKVGTFSWLDNVFVKRRGIVKKAKSKAKSFSLKITVPKVTLTDDNITLVCEGFGMGGLGKSQGSYNAVLRVIDPPKILTKFPTNQNKLRGAKESVTVDCRASGNPKPTVSWTRKNGAKLKSEAVNGGQRLILKAPISDNYDGTYICSARLSSEFVSVPGVKVARRELRFNVFYKPTLVFKKKLVRTDLGTRETLEIVVTGNPQPNVNCQILKLPEPKLVRFTPQAGHKMTYEVVLQAVRKVDIRPYMCEASNSVGSVKDTVTLTLAPSAPKILSANSTTYSDYYELHWEVKSKAPISNVTVDIHTKSNKKNGNSTKLRTQVFQLNSNARSFRHHIANLSQDTHHELRLRACNSRACNAQKAVAAFRTKSYNGNNKVDPEILVKAITEAPVGASSTGGVATSVSPSLCALLFGFAAAVAQQNGGR